MPITKRIQQFINEVAAIASQDSKDVTFNECVSEYTSQIQEDDFYCFVNYANWKGVKIPRALKSAIDPNF